MALTRFVNATTDLGQNQKYARSIRDIARSINMERWLVDQRHEATHGSLPSYSILQQAARVSLDWIYDSYWLPQFQLVYELHQKVHDTLEEYGQLCERLDLKLGYLLSQIKGKGVLAKRQREVITGMERTIKELIQTLSPVHMTQELIPCLLQHSSFIPFNTTPELSLDQSELTEASKRWEVGIDAISELWPHFVATLFMSLIDNIEGILKEETNDLNKKLLNAMTGWVIYISESEKYISSIKESPVGIPFKHLMHLFVLFPYDHWELKKAIMNLMNTKQKQKIMESGLMGWADNSTGVSQIDFLKSLAAHNDNDNDNDNENDNDSDNDNDNDNNND
eukprot:CAMPEP_0174258002 /NCGR_PEP_ID=MMETSP0439-20130205/7085_1 /TAXON_ID=0 /ORGANISM="Stereomyxa ramosa, Strain Chinc5" /LENGTH=336 /DNA_ID=CAMNT_0015341343 /DNA_START=379 /DNA_END=1386 /DNA_ORIENTATION=+